MKKMIFLLAIAAVAFGVYWFKFRSSGSGDSGPKQEALKVGKHTPAFNDSVSKVLAAYFDIQNAFVEADTTAAKAACSRMIALADSFTLAELKKDTAGIFESALSQLDNIKANAKSLLQQTVITEMRQDFRMVSENLYPFLKTIKYEGKPLYWQNCPMAFGDGKEANWLSSTLQVVNPYLGKKDPTYGAGMLHCGEVKDTIK